MDIQYLLFLQEFRNRINYAKPVIQTTLGGHWGKLTYNIIFAIYLILVYPLVIRLVTGKKEASAKAGRA